MTTKLLTGLLIGALLSASALAENRVEVSIVNGKQQASFSLGESRCVLVNEVIRCAPVLVASH
jgi:hypothetical protein